MTWICLLKQKVGTIGGEVCNESTTRYSEYKSTGKHIANKRVKWSRQLTAQEALVFSKNNVLGDWIVN